MANAIVDKYFKKLLNDWLDQIAIWSVAGDLKTAALQALKYTTSPPVLQGLIEQWALRDFSKLPRIELLNSNNISGAAGAYVASTGTIYLNEEWLARATQEKVLAVLTEELGHHLDALLNANDTPGDEGLAFARLLLGNEISPERSTATDDAILLKIGSGIIAEAALIVGDSGNDTIYGGNEADTLKGLGGNDEIHGGDGNDTIEGGDGNDTLYGDEGNDTIEGGAGIDIIYGGIGNDVLSDVGDSTLYGDDGDDTIRATSTEPGRASGLKVYGGAGNDFFEAPTFASVDAGSGDDTVQMSAGGSQVPTLLDGGTGYDKLQFGWYGWSGCIINWANVNGFEEIYFSGDNGGGLNTIFTDNVGKLGETLKITTSRNGHGLRLDFSAETDANLEITGIDTYSPDDILIGGSLADIIQSLGGNDVVKGNGGNDDIDMGSGDDIATGGQGDDTIDGGLGTDIAVYSGNKSQYDLTEISYGYYQLVDRVGTDGTDKLRSIEKLRFADQDLDITPQGLSLNGSSENDKITGDSGNDLINGIAGNDTLKGLGGNDEIHGGDGNDTIEGGDGNDTLYGDGGNDTIEGGAGIDIIYGGIGNDVLSDVGDSTLYGDDGDDTIRATSTEPGRASGLKVYGGAGNDFFEAPTFASVDAGSGDDTVQMSAGGSQVPTLLDGGTGYDKLQFGWYGWSGCIINWANVNGFEEIYFSGDNGGGLNTIFTDNVGKLGETLKITTSRNGHGLRLDFSAETDANLEITGIDTYSPDDILIGGSLADIIQSLGGNDVVKGNGGNDDIDMGSGDDIATGGQGDDTIDGGLGTDIAVYSGNKSQYDLTEISYGYYQLVDRVGTDGTDKLRSIEKLRFADQDLDITPQGLSLNGSSENDKITGDSGNDLINGIAGNDTLKGLGGNDEIHGGDGNDTIEGGDGNDTLYGDGGNDTIEGGAGIDIIYGGIGNDVLSDVGDSTLYGDDGDDTIRATSTEPGRASGLKVYGGAGNDFFEAPTFASVDAGSGDDTVQMSAGGSQVPTLLDGGTGYDKLQFGWYGWSGCIINWANVNGFEEIYFSGDNGGGLNTIFTDNVGKLGETLKITTSRNGHGLRLDFSAETDANLEITGIDTYSPDDILIGGSLADIIQSLGGNDVVKGNGGNDDIDMGSGDDIATGGQGDDTIDGGLGTDIAVYSGNRNQYTLSYNTDGLQQVIKVSGAEGVDSLKNVEILRFADSDLDVRPIGRTIRDRGQGKLEPIIGKPIVGEILTTGRVLDDPDGINDQQSNTLYQWQLASTAQDAWIDIGGSNSNTYNLTSSNNGARIRVAVTYSDLGGVRSTLYSDPVAIQSKALPDISFNPVSDDDYISAAAKDGGIILSGKDNGSEVTITFSGATRKAASSNGIWSYFLTSLDWQNLVSGANIFTASFSAEGDAILELSRTIYIDQSIIISDNSLSIDRSQAKGISLDTQTVLDANGNLLDFDKNGKADAYQPDIVILPWKTSEVFDLGAQAELSDFAAIKVPSLGSIKGIDVLELDGNKYLVPLADGSEFAAEIPKDYKASLDPVAFNLSGLNPGATVTTTVYLPDSVQAAETYLRFNYSTEEFQPYVDKNGVPLYRFEFSQGKPDKVILTLVDGDPEWDGDGTKNGRIVDPGTVAIASYINDGAATFAVSGTVQVGQVLTVAKTADDPDGNGSLGYQWQSSTDGNTWSNIGSNAATYTLTAAEQSKQIRVLVAYTDAQNFQELITVSAGTVDVDMPKDISILDIDLGMINDKSVKSFKGLISQKELAVHRFSVSDSTYAYITLDNFDVDLDLHLYKDMPDGQNNILYMSSESEGVTSENIFKKLSAGNYIAFAVPYDISAGKFGYDLEIDTQWFYDNTTIPNDTEFEKQWYLFNTGQGGGIDNWDVNGPESWKINKSTEEIIVAVIDSGIDYLHQDLNANIWINKNEIPNNGLDDDNNGYSDDIWGWDFADNDNNPMASTNQRTRDHGTHVAGTIGAVSNNNLGIAGVNWNAKLMNLKIFPDGLGEKSKLENTWKAIRYAADNGAKVINLSIGDSLNDPLYENIFLGGFETFKKILPDLYNGYYNALSYASSKGVVIVASASNENNNNDKYSTIPADFSLEIPGMISVAALSNKGDKASYSNYGNVISIAAPGGDFGSDSLIYSTIVDNKYGYMAGTSMAAPIVSGAVSLILAQNPRLTPSQVKNIILEGAYKDKSLESVVGDGAYLDIYASLEKTLELKLRTAKFDVIGTPQVGQALFVAKVADDPDEYLENFSYQWQSSTDGNTWSNIGSNAATYTLTAAEQTKQIRVQVSYTDAQYYKELVVVPAGTVSDSTVSAINDGAATHSIFAGNGGTAVYIVGQRLLVEKTATDPDGGHGIRKYQWQSSADGNTWSTIGTNNEFYTLTVADQAKQIRVQISYTDGEGFQENITVAGGYVPIVKEPIISITGNYIPSSTLTANVQLDPNSPYINSTFTYTWYANKEIIAAQTTKTLILTDDLVGKRISATASFTNSAGQSTSISTAEKQVQAGFTNSKGIEVKADVRLENANLDGGFTTINATTNPNAKKAVDALKANKVELSPTMVNFTIALPSNPTKPAENQTSASIAIGIDLVSDGIALSTGNGAASKPTPLSYYSVDSAGVASPFTYDPVSKTGANFYDTNSDGTPDLVTLAFVDGGRGDKDGFKNGKIVDPSTAATVNVSAVLANFKDSLLIADPLSDLPAALIVKAKLISRAATVNEIGYVVLDKGETIDSIGFAGLTARAQILFAGLESSDVPNLSSFSFDKSIALINGQSIRFFETTDSSLKELAAGKSSVAGLGSSFKFLSTTIDSSTTKATAASSSGMNFSLEIAGSFAGLDSLIGVNQADSPILDFSALAGIEVTADLSLAREASYNSSIGFYKILAIDGSVRDPISGNVFLPGDSGYKNAALSNKVTNLKDLSIGNLQNTTNEIKINESGMLAPYAIVSGADTYFAYAAANADLISHFKVLGTNIIGLEDLYGGGDKDFDDVVIGIKAKTLSAI